MSDAPFVCEAKPSAIGRRICSFRYLPVGWHFGEGHPATDAAVSMALAVAELLPSCDDVEAFPGVDGGILVSAYHHDETLEVRCEPDGRVDFWHEVNDEIVEEQEDVWLAKVVDYLGDLAWEQKKRNSSAFCTLSITAHAGADSPVSPSDHPPTMVGSRYLMPRVLSLKAGESVRTSAGITRMSRVIRPSSGGSTPMACFQMMGGASAASLRQPETHATGTFAALQKGEADRSLGTTFSTMSSKSVTTKQAHAH